MGTIADASGANGVSNRRFAKPSGDVRRNYCRECQVVRLPRPPRGIDMRRTTRFAATLVAAIAMMAAPAARGQQWVGGNADWNTAANWTPATVPNSPTAAVFFIGGGSAFPAISASVQAQSLTF